MKIPQYPNDFFSFADGVDISNDQINDWIKSCIDRLEKSNGNMTSTSSGNTLVRVIRMDREEAPVKYEIEAVKSYSEARVEG